MVYDHGVSNKDCVRARQVRICLDFLADGRVLMPLDPDKS
jgi:hypothetical protein